MTLGQARRASKCIPGPNQAVAITDAARGFKRSRRRCFLTLLLLDRRPSTFTARPYRLLTSPWMMFPRTAHCCQRGHLRGAKHINQTRRTQAWINIGTAGTARITTSAHSCGYVGEDKQRALYERPMVCAHRQQTAMVPMERRTAHTRSCQGGPSAGRRPSTPWYLLTSCSPTPAATTTIPSRPPTWHQRASNGRHGGRRRAARLRRVAQQYSARGALYALHGASSPGARLQTTRPSGNMPRDVGK